MRTRPASATAAWTPNGSGSVASTLTPIGRQRLQRVEVGLAGLGVLRRDRAAADVSVRHDDRFAEPDAPAEPLVLLVLVQAVDAEVHPEPAPVDLADAEQARHRAQRAGAEQRGSAAAHAVGRRPGRLERAAGSCPAKSEIASLHGPSTTRTGTVAPQNCASSAPSVRTCSATVVPSGNASSSRPCSSSWRGTICWRAPRPLLFTSRLFSSTRKNCRSPVTPASVSSQSSSWRSARPLTGEIEIQATLPLTRQSYAKMPAWQSPLKVNRRQILAFRRRVGSLDERMPKGAESLRRAAWAGLQDSMPRAALLSLHARVEEVEPSTWEHRSLAQLWGPRYQVYVVPKRDFALFSLARLPEDEKGRLRAQQMAERLHAHLRDRRMTDRELGWAVGVGNELRYATKNYEKEINECADLELCCRSCLWARKINYRAGEGR